MTTDLENGKVRVTVTALDKNDEFLNFLSMSGSVVGPDMKPIDLKIRQTAPGRYVGEFDSPQSGSYFLMLNPGAGMAPILSGVNVPYSAEYLDRETNEGLIHGLASLPAKGTNEAGQVIEDKKGTGLPALLEFDTYRHNFAKATSSQDIWHLLMLVAACLFFADVFVRRVHVSFEWLPPLLGRVRDRILRREPEPVQVEVIERLRSRKAAVAAQIEERRAGARFEPPPDAPAPDIGTLSQGGEGQREKDSGGRGGSASPGVPPQSEAEKAADDYTSRLLKAKKKVWEDRGDEGPK